MREVERFFHRTYPRPVITQEMLEMSYHTLLAYCGQLYRRVDRIMAILEREKKEGEHTKESLVFGIGKQARVDYDRYMEKEDYDEDEDE